MTTYSNSLPSKIPWTKETGRLLSMESQKDGNHWATEHTHACTHTHTCIYRITAVQVFRCECIFQNSSLFFSLVKVKPYPVGICFFPVSAYTYVRPDPGWKRPVHSTLNSFLILWHRHTHTHTHILDFSSGSTVKNPSAKQETWVQSLGREDPLEEGIATHSSVLAWRIPMDKGAWWARVHGVAKSQTQMKWLTMHVHTHTHILYYIYIIICNI